MRIRDLYDAALDAEIADLIENATAGATSAASVATCIGAPGGIGAGFDPTGDYGIYPKPKQPKSKKAGVIRRIPS